jgi:hypothetical protein
LIKANKFHQKRNQTNFWSDSQNQVKTNYHSEMLAQKSKHQWFLSKFYTHGLVRKLYLLKTLLSSCTTKLLTIFWLFNKKNKPTTTWCLLLISCRACYLRRSRIVMFLHLSWLIGSIWRTVKLRSLYFLIPHVGKVLKRLKKWGSVLKRLIFNRFAFSRPKFKKEKNIKSDSAAWLHKETTKFRSNSSPNNGYHTYQWSTTFCKTISKENTFT